MKSLFFKIILLFFVSVIYVSCSTEEIPVVEPEPIIETVKYNTDVKAIMDANCVSCHSTTGSASFLVLSNYASTRNATENGNLVSRMNNSGNPMPPSGLLDAQTRAIIDKWVTDGYLEN